jgi:hypothetical protein
VACCGPGQAPDGPYLALPSASLTGTPGCRMRAGGGRNDGRNCAFADLLFESGLRLREGGCLLTLEVPDVINGQVYYEGTVAAAIAKRRERMFYVNAEALCGIATYMATTRRAAIRRAQRKGAYDRLRGKLIVIKISGPAASAVLGGSVREQKRRPVQCAGCSRTSSPVHRQGRRARTAAALADRGRHAHGL